MITTKVKSVGREYQASGETLDEALAKITISNGARAVSVLTVTKKEGDTEITKERILNPNQTQRLFGNTSPSTRAFVLKWVKQMFP